MKVLVTNRGPDQRDEMLERHLRIMRPYFDHMIVASCGAGPVPAGISDIADDTSIDNPILWKARDDFMSKTNRGDHVVYLDSDELPTRETLEFIGEGKMEPGVLYHRELVNYWLCGTIGKPIYLNGFAYVDDGEVAFKHTGSHSFLVHNGSQRIEYKRINHFKGAEGYHLSTFLFWLADPDHHNEHNNGAWRGPERDEWDRIREANGYTTLDIQSWVRNKKAPEPVMEYVKSLRDNKNMHLHNIYHFACVLNFTVRYPNVYDFDTPDCQYDNH